MEGRWYKVLGGLLLGMLLSSVASAEGIQKTSLLLIKDLTRAELYYIRPAYKPTGVLILCPGVNGSSEGMLKKPDWQKFASDHQLGLIGLSFASDIQKLKEGKGYYYASQGSGDLLLRGIQRIFTESNLPIILFGFSGGAHFTSRFAEWKPERVTSWCAYSAGWWDEPKASSKSPPGIVVCGDEDDRYGASLMYFKKGRSLGKPWLWISPSKVGHSIEPTIEIFVRMYFEKILHPTNAQGLWVDIDQEIKVDQSKVIESPSITAWLPDETLLDAWKQVHEP